MLLAALQDGERDALLDSAPVAALTPRTVTDGGELRAELERVRAQGWSLVDQELEDGIRSIAAPVTRGDRVVAAINISTTAGSGSMTEMRERLLAPLLRTAAAISAEVSRIAV